MHQTLYIQCLEFSSSNITPEHTLLQTQIYLFFFTGLWIILCLRLVHTHLAPGGKKSSGTPKCSQLIGNIKYLKKKKKGKSFTACMRREATGVQEDKEKSAKAFKQWKRSSVKYSVTVSGAWWVWIRYKSTLISFWFFWLFETAAASVLRRGIRAGRTDWLPLSSRSGCGRVLPDRGCTGAGSEPRPPASAGRRRWPQTGSSRAAASWGWRRSRPPAEGRPGAWEDEGDGTVTSLVTESEVLMFLFLFFYYLKPDWPSCAAWQTNSELNFQL